MSDVITVTGNIATEPEQKQTPAGLPITSFRLASTQRRFDRSTGAWVDGPTNWYTVSMFRGLADHAFRSLQKGHRVVLTGRLRLREWDNGTKKGLAAEIEADAIGHDLRWGTTQYEKAAATGGERGGHADEWAVDGGRGPSDADADEQVDAEMDAAGAARMPEEVTTPF